jgi:hypothetical protein
VVRTVRRTAKWVLAAAAAVLLLTAAVAIEDAREPESAAGPTAVDVMQERRQAFIRDEVRRGLLPPETLRMLQPDGTIEIDFVPGPGGDEDLVLHEDSGRPLSWDLDGSGRITRDERRITERELYDATLGMVYDAGPTHRPPPPERPA